MSGPRVLLLTLAERTSAKGNDYLSGWLGKARLVGFKAKEPDKYGNEVWEIYAQEPESKEDSARPNRNAERGQRTWDRSRDQKTNSHREKSFQAQAAGKAVHDAAPDRPFYDDSDAAVAGLEGRAP